MMGDGSQVFIPQPGEEAQPDGPPGPKSDSPSASSSLRMIMEDGSQALNTHLDLADLLRDQADLRHLDADEGGSIAGWYLGEYLSPAPQVVALRSDTLPAT